MMSIFLCFVSGLEIDKDRSTLRIQILRQERVEEEGCFLAFERRQLDGKWVK